MGIATVRFGAKDAKERNKVRRRREDDEECACTAYELVMDE